MIRAARPLGIHNSAMVRQLFPTPRIRTPFKAVTSSSLPLGRRTLATRAPASISAPERRKRALTSSMGENDSRPMRIAR